MNGSNRARVVDLISASTANHEYFFANLDDAAWLPFLLEAGFFTKPWPPETWVTKRGERLIRCPIWPESRYLARIAPQAHDLVFEAAKRIPDNENPRIHEDIVTIAAQLPGEQAAVLARREQRWLAGFQGHLFSFPEPAADLLAHLAAEGQLAATFALAGTLLGISPAQETEDRPRRGRAQSLVSNREYAEIVERAWPPLIEADPNRAFGFLCHQLVDTIRISYTDEGSVDRTHLWRPAIENRENNHGRTLLDTLVELVRDVALKLAETPGGLNLVLTELARHDAQLFRRIRLFLLAGHGPAELAANELSDAGLISTPPFWHEYSCLLEARFGDLDEGQREPILALIAAGPPPELTAARVERGIPMDRIQRQSRYWQLERYARIASHLSGEPREACEALLEELGEPRHPIFPIEVSSGRGTVSPYSAEKLREMGPSAAAIAISTWESAGDIEDPAREDLAQALQSAVAADADRFLAAFAQFADLDLEYLVGFLGGLVDATREGVAFPWERALDLCELIVGREQSEEAARNGGSPRRRITSLIANGLRDTPAQFPIEVRERVWGLVELLLADADPTSDRDQTDSDLATVAINSVRGEAMHAALRYALWVERALKADGSFEGIASLPELRSVLDRHLDTEVEPSRAIRSVYGEWFVQLVRIDKEYARELSPRIFPAEEESTDWWLAAWDSYVVFNRPWLAVFEVLEDAYRLAIERFDQSDDELGVGGDPRESLGEHLMFLRIMGAIDLDENGLFPSFWRTASSEVRKHVIGDVGWSLEHGEGTLSNEVRARLVETWEWIASEPDSRVEELAAFGSWFGASDLNDAWLLAQGAQVLGLGVQLDPDHVVYQALPRLVAEFPREAIEVLRLMVVTDAEDWSVLGSVDEVRTAISATLASNDDRAREEAIALINLLGAQGIKEFRDLLPADSGRSGRPD